MNIANKARTAVRALREDGFQAMVSLIMSRLPFAWSAKFKWDANISTEVQFWDDYFRTKGGKWAETYAPRFDPDLPLQPRAAALLPAQTEVHILDVGAGPTTFLGKKCEGKRIEITAVDPLADKYDKILDKYNIHPLVRTQKLAAEDLREKFGANTFDLVFALNCIDHAYNPEKAIVHMIEVVKSGRYVLLQHRPHEAENENYSGLHQWNFASSAEGDFIISSRSSSVNMTKKYAELCTMTCEMVNEGKLGDWLVTRIRKK